MIGKLGAVWGLGGVLAVLGYAILRLSQITMEAFQEPFDGRHWALLVINTLFMAYSEGYKGFQKSYAPRVVARAQVLTEEPTALRVLLAPLFCMTYFQSTRRRLIAVYILTFAIVTLIVIFQYIPQPWRGILDLGVVVGLSWGSVSLLVFAFQAWLGSGFDASPELPEQ